MIEHYIKTTEFIMMTYQRRMCSNNDAFVIATVLVTASARKTKKRETNVYGKAMREKRTATGTTTGRRGLLRYNNSSSNDD